MQRWPVGETIRYDGSPHPLVEALPYYRFVPKEPIAHLEYRIQVAERCLTDTAYRQGIQKCCEEDFLFWVNTFAWIIEPRDETGDSILPFNTWCNQDPVMAAMAHYLGRRRDIVGDKSRAQGATWMVVALYVWGILYRKRKAFGFMSKDEDTADDYKDPSSVGWKIDFIIKNLPPWMRPPGMEPGDPNRSTSQHTWTNSLTDSTIKGYAANKTSARGGRFTSFFLDEAGSFGSNRDLEALSNLQQTCFNRIVISTPNGTDIEFYRLVTTPSIWLKVILDWEDNPSQNAGKYTSVDGKLKILDEDYEFPPDYKFVLDGIVRSPWFDHECARANWNMVEINRELRRDHGGSKTRPFPAEAIETANRYLRDPVRRGALGFERADPSDIDSIKWRSDSTGPWSLWFSPSEDGFPPPGKYGMGIDIAAGTASSTTSNSVIQIFNSVGEQVAEFASNKVSPPRLARLAVAACYWFGRGNPEVYLNFEKTGPLGTQFSSALKKLMYPNLYYQKDRQKRGAKRSNNPGHHTSKTADVLEVLANTLSDEQIVLRSRDLAKECAEYEFADNGDWIHPGNKGAKDAADKGFNHGDRAMAAAIAIIALLDRNMLPNAKPVKQQDMTLAQAPTHSMAGRMREKMRRQQEYADNVSCVW